MASGSGGEYPPVSWQLSAGMFIGTAMLFNHLQKSKKGNGDIGTAATKRNRSAVQSSSKSSKSIADNNKEPQQLPLAPSQTSQTSNAIDSNKNGEDVLMDRPDLDQRLLRKAEAVIQWRTTRLILVIERCTNDHNYSAILRTAEALGIQKIYMIDPPDVEDDPALAKTKTGKAYAETATPEEVEQRRQHHFFARNAQEWLDLTDFETSEECVEKLKDEGYDLWVTDLSQEAVCLDLVRTPDSIIIPKKVALVMGTEAVGCSQYMLDAADKRVYLPLRGFADSLNLSVATALIMHHLFVMDPTLVGGITEEEKSAIRLDWYTKLCQQRLLTQSQKRHRQKLMYNIEKCKTIQGKIDKGGYKPQPSELKRVAALPKYEKELAELNALVDPQKVQVAVQEWVENPPQPLGDLRRADIHRVCFVGKNTKSLHQDHWKDMPATSNYQTTHKQTASEMRKKFHETQNTPK